MEIIVIVLLILAFVLAYGIGANDETMSPIVSTKTLSVKQAVIIAGVFSFLGAFFLSKSVGKTIGKNLLGAQITYNSYMMVAIILSTAIWLIVASKIGAPISTTHSIVGSIMGLSFVLSINEGINWMATLNWVKVGEVCVGWVTSPIFGFIGAVFFQWIVSKAFRRRNNGLLRIEKIEKYFIIILLISLCLTQLSRGGNDAGSAIGVFYGLIEAENAKSGSGIEANSLPALLFIIGIMMAFGIIMMGKNVIKNVGEKLIEMRPSEAFAVSISTTIIIYFATISGLPVSGTHILIFAILGASWFKGEKPDRKLLIGMVASWILTIPIAAVLCAAFYSVFILFI